jgi:hypothetical protein
MYGARKPLVRSAVLVLKSTTPNHVTCLGQVAGRFAGGSTFSES